MNFHDIWHDHRSSAAGCKELASLNSWSSDEEKAAEQAEARRSDADLEVQ